MAHKILVVDDEPANLELVSHTLRQAGYIVITAASGADALAQFARVEPDLVILDLMLPDADCLAKPFSPRELAARVKAALRRVRLPAISGLDADIEPQVMGALTIELDTRRDFLDGVALDLPLKEFDLLAYLMANADRVLPRDRILLDAWGYDVGFTRTLDVHVRRLRQKLQCDVDGTSREDVPRIQTVRGVGYRLLSPSTAGFTDN